MKILKLSKTKMLSKLFILILFLFLFNCYSADIDDFMDRISIEYSYISDMEQFGVRDYWQTPKEFAKNKMGDCEDYAFYIVPELRKLGFQVKTYIVVCKEADHAINVVRSLNFWDIYITSNDELLHSNKYKVSDIEVIEDFCKLYDWHLKKIYRINNIIYYGEQNLNTCLDNLILIKTYYE